MATSLRMMSEKLGPDNDVVKRVLGGLSPEAAAREAIENTHLDDPSYRKHLYQGGVQAVEQSNDPLIVMVETSIPMPGRSANNGTMRWIPFCAIAAP